MLSTQETYERTAIFIALYSCATVIVSIIAAPILQLGIIYLFVAIFHQKTNSPEKSVERVITLLS